MRITKLQNTIGVGVGTKIKVKNIFGRVIIHTILSLSSTGRWYTDRGYYISKDFTVEGQEGIIATWKPIPFKQFKFRYKR